jgi:hypothetical protein
MHEDKERLLDFAAVQDAEQRAGMPPRGNALGLAFSGGGIRSATFNLGVIQALAERGLLRRFDYLSTISGGGYIGSWLSLFIKRYAGGDVGQAEQALKSRDADGLEHRAIRFLRSFSNYLTPRVGLSKDTLVAVATYLRNLLLNLTILVTLIGAVLLLPRIAALVADMLQGWARFENWRDAIMAVLLVLPAFAVALGLLYRPTERGVHRPWFMRGPVLIALIDMPVLAAVFVSASYYIHAAVHSVSEPYAWFRSVVLAYIVLWVIGLVLATVFLPDARGRARALVARDKAKWHFAFLAFAVLAGALGGALLNGIAGAIRALPVEHRLWVGVTLGPPAVISVIMLMVVAHIGFMGRKFGEPDRELWSVFGARLMALVLAWVLLFGIAYFGAAATRWTNDWVVGLGGAAWVLTTLFGVFAGRSKKTGTPEANRGLELLTRFAPYAFVLGLLLVMSWGVHRALEAADQARGGPPSLTQPLPSAPPGITLRADPLPGRPVVTVRGPDEPGLWNQFLSITATEYGSIRRWFEPWWALPGMALALFAAALLMSWRVNINLFSLHHFYRNRLTRCYLGATNPERKPHALTGFDPEDDVSFADLAPGESPRVQRPLHIVGTAINLNRGRQLAWQNRRAASFAFTPLHAGYQPASAQVSGGFRAVGQYGVDAQGHSIMLGTTVAISGAAASPNMGYHTSPAVAFLLTVFNVRLGHWCGDTAHEDAWRKRDPVLGLRYWLAELTGTADQDYPFVSLSDGGHFENLGIYELVRRRCALILASDAGADPKYAFEDLAEAMRKCYTDFGVRIVFGATGVDGIRPKRKKPSERHHAIARIEYPDGMPPGTLIYWKSSVTAAMPPDILNYQRTRKDFPHESTADQFFDEAQFESYRNLGYEVALRSLDSMRDQDALPEALK